MNTATHPSPMHMNGSPAVWWPRTAAAIVGVWLFISAFLWPHTMAQMTNTWICGALAVIFAWVAAYAAPIRWLSTLLAIWIFVSAFALPVEHGGTIWNNAIVGLVLFILSLISNGARVPSAPAT